jgi:hypothetical protein
MSGIGLQKHFGNFSLPIRGIPANLQSKIFADDKFARIFARSVCVTTTPTPS